MKKKNLSLIIMVVLLAGLLLAYAVVSGMDTDSGEGTETEADSSISVNSISQTSITGISYTVDGVERTFTLSSDKWTYAQDASFPVSTKAIAEIASALSGIRAERAIEGDLRSAEFGLDSPRHTIKVTLSAGGTLIYNIGDYNKHADCYYMTAEGHDRVYLVTAAFGELFDGELYDLVECESFPTISTDKVNKITANIGESTLTLEKKTEGESTVWTHTNREGGTAELAQESVDKILTALTQQKLTKCVEHNVSDECMAELSLGEANREKITVSYEVTIDAQTGQGTLGGATTVEKELVYYIGRVDVPVASDTADTTADTTADITADTTADTAGTTADTAGTTEQKTERKTYLMLEGSRMVYEVSLTGADVFFE